MCVLLLLLLLQLHQTFQVLVWPPMVHVLQVGAHAMAVCETLARRIAATGGAALLVDYGRNEPYTNSLTAIRAHAGEPTQMDFCRIVPSSEILGIGMLCHGWR
jgi:hypothetical protein